jgi:hypothetical protein
MNPDKRTIFGALILNVIADEFPSEWMQQKEQMQEVIQPLLNQSGARKNASFVVTQQVNNSSHLGKILKDFPPLPSHPAMYPLKRVADATPTSAKCHNRP